MTSLNGEIAPRLSRRPAPSSQYVRNLVQILPFGPDRERRLEHWRGRWYATSGILEIFNFLLTGAEIVLWITIVCAFTENFATASAWNAYENFDAVIGFAKLANDGANLGAYLDKLSFMSHLVNVHSAYTLIHAFNIMVFVVRHKATLMPSLARLTWRQT